MGSRSSAKYVAAVAFASEALGKARQTLTRGDLIRARALAYRAHRVEVTPSLHVLIESEGLRDLYCRGPVPRRAPRSSGHEPTKTPP
jgi:hypothetical protein